MTHALHIPQDAETCVVKYHRKTLTFTNLKRVLWPHLNKTKRDLLLYYAALSGVLLPHLRDRGLVIRKHLDTCEGKPVLLKQLPAYRPEWLETSTFVDSSGYTVELPMAQDLASLLWMVNAGCLGFCLLPVRYDDMKRPDYLVLDLDPVSPAQFPQVRQAALLIRELFSQKNVTVYASTSGCRGIHIYIPIHRKFYCKDVWRTAKQIAVAAAQRHPDLLTAERIVKKRLPGQVMINYSRNMEGHAFSSPYSLRTSPEATVSTPVSWEELEKGMSPSAFTIDTVPRRVERIGDLFRPLLRPSSRFPLQALL